MVKLKKKMFLALVIILALVLLSACGPSEEEQNATGTQIAANIFGTQTAEAPTHTPTPLPTDTPTPTNTATPTPLPTDTPTPTPTPLPTDTPTPTETPTPDLEILVPAADDLAPSFEEVSPELMELFGGAGISDAPGTTFSYISDNPFEFLFGAVNQFSSQFERNTFDTQVSNPQLLAMQTLSGLEITGLDDPRVRDYEEFEDLEELGDRASGFTAAVDQEGIILRIDMIAFRRGDIGVIAFVMYEDGTEPLTDIRELTRAMDKRIVDSFPE
jgi:hypothetical protein